MLNLHDTIEDYLNKENLKLYTLDEYYVSCIDEKEKYNVLNSKIIKGFLDKYNRGFIDIDSLFIEVCNSFGNGKKKTRKEFYFRLLTKTVDLNELLIEL